MYSALSLVSKAGSARTSAGLQPAASPKWKPIHALQSRSCTRVVCSAGSESTASQSEQFNADRTAVDAARRLAQQGQEPASEVFAEVLDNPDFDDIELNDELYRELGLTEDEIEAQRMYSAYDVDPEGVDLGIGSVSMPGDGLGNLQEQKLGDDAYGPEVRMWLSFCCAKE